MSKNDRMHSDPNRCDRCSYDLTGLPDDGRCPVCSRSIKELRAEIRERYIGPAVHRKLDRSVPCAQCGYELEGLLLESACPECGTPLNASLGGRLLRYAPDKQLKLLSTASQWLVGASFLLMLGFVDAKSYVAGAIGWSIGLIYLARCSVPEARGRKFAMVASILMFVLVAVDIVNVRIGLGIDPTVLNTVLVGMLAITITAGFWLIEDLALCLPNRWIAKAIRALRWTLPVPVVFVVGILWQQQLGAVHPVVVVLTALLSFVWFCLLTLFLWEFHTHLSDEHQYVKAVGERAGPVPPMTAESVHS